MKEDSFIMSPFVQMLKDEIGSLSQGESGVERAEAIVELGQVFISSQKLEIEKEEELIKELEKIIQEQNPNYKS